MEQYNIPLPILMISLFENNSLIILDDLYSLKLLYYNQDLFLNCLRRGDDLVLALSEEPDDVFSDVNLACDREQFDYEEDFIAILKLFAKKARSINITVRRYSIEAVIYAFAKISDIDRRNLFFALRDMDVNFLGAVPERMLRKGKFKYKRRQS